MDIKKVFLLAVVVLLPAYASKAVAQGILHHVDSIMSHRYDQTDIDTAYVVRPPSKWTVRARINVSGTKIETEGIDRSASVSGSSDDGLHFKSEMEADRKATLSLGVSYLGFSLSTALNPAKLMGKYRDFEINFNSYGPRLGFDIIYQDAKNFKGWHDHEGMERIELPPDMLKVRTLNVNAYYAFNSRRFSYPAAFSQSYIQRRSAGSLLLGASGQAQHADLDYAQMAQLKMTNLAIGAGYGYNYVPSQGWLLHLSALPTFIVYSNTSMSFDDTRIPLHYHFPEVIITSRGAVVRQWGNKFAGISMVFNFTNVGHEESLTVHNIKWRIRTFFGLRLGKR